LPDTTSGASIVAASLFIAAILTGRVGGGHYNMAVTTAVYIMEYKNWRKNIPIALTIIVSDIVGGFFGCLIKALFTGWDNLVILSPVKGSGKSVYQVYFEEAMFSFLFLGVILHCKYSNVASTRDGVLACLTIAITLFGLVSMAALQTGACFNPTIGITFTIMEFARSVALGDALIKYIIAYILGPLTGAIAAALWLLFPGFYVSPRQHEYVHKKRDDNEQRYTVNDDDIDRFI
jgi:glycerol uptake facilitator-like aquaporin